ncbi:MAG: phosphoadenosine phosphosulfate reductase family protein [Lachnospiraceae bacterium]
MGDVLGRKQRIKNSDWADAFEKIEQSVTKKELDCLVEKTIKDIKKKTKGKKAAYAWSGGKDSLVLGEICQRAGITPCVLVICNLEYKAFIEWVDEHKPPELSIINTEQDIKWLAAHPHMLFPQDSKYASQWFQIVQHRGQAKYYKENELDMLLLGRRRADGNYVGRGDNIYINKQGITRYSPISDWTHEQVLAFIHYYNLELPPIYNWKNGYLCGTHPWPARQWTESIENAWIEIYEIDSSIVIEAAEYIQSAKDFLEKSNKLNQH